MEHLKKGAEFLRETFWKSPLEKELYEATSNDNWGCSNTNLIKIADASLDYENFDVIMKFIWDRVFDSKAKDWKRIYKSLNLLEFLIKCGNPQCTT